MKFVVQSRGAFLAARLKDAMDGIGCNKDLVNEIFCLSSTAEINAMKTSFEGRSDKSLADRLRSELSGEHEKLIIHLLTRGRGEGPANQAQAEAQAKDLQQVIKNGSGMIGGLKEAACIKVFEILCGASPDQCIAIKGTACLHLL